MVAALLTPTLTFNFRFQQQKSERSIASCPPHTSNKEEKYTLFPFLQKPEAVQRSAVLLQYFIPQFQYFVLFWIKYDVEYKISMRNYTSKLFLLLADYNGQSSPSLFLESNLNTPDSCGLPHPDAVCVAAWAPKTRSISHFVSNIFCMQILTWFHLHCQ